MAIGRDTDESRPVDRENVRTPSCHKPMKSGTSHRTTSGFRMNGCRLCPSVGTVFWMFIVSCLLLGTLVQAEQDKDFEFEGENLISEDAKIVDGTFLDDEDYLHDDGSTPDDDDDDGVTGSGTEPTEISTIFPTTREPNNDGPVFYRITLNFTNVRYETPLGDRNTGDFQQAALRYKRAIEGLFKDIPGRQTVNILQFRPGSADLEAYPPSMLVTADLGTVEYYYQLTIFNTLNGALNRGYVGTYEVSPHGYSFRPISDFTIVTPSPTLTCSPHEFRCRDGTCIDVNRRCDNRPDCPDRSDEYQCVCSPGEFQCESGECVDLSKKCNHEYDCRDSSDEFNCDVEGCSVDEFDCGDGMCLDESLHCNGVRDCPAGQDEINCHHHECLYYQFRCDNFRCIDTRRRCNQHDDCGDGSDERGCGACDAGTEYECVDGTCIDVRRQCDGFVDCADGSDERECPEPTCPPGHFQCPTSGHCLEAVRQCDGYVDCEDGADEQQCERPACGEEEFTCGDGACIDPRRKCDGYQDCRDGSDETSCEVACSSTEYTCTDGTCIDARRKCDGRADCPNRDDELNCVVEVPCTETEFACGDGSCIDARRTCDGHPDCSDNSDEHECEPVTCSADEFQCGNGLCVHSGYKCDGVEHCVDGSDEANCAPTTTCLWWQFSCNNGQCIDQRRKCNGQAECSDGSDERGCDGVEECLSTEFTCEDGTCIDSRRECDGRDDCADGSDEYACEPVCDPSREFTCTSGECISLSQRCDRQYDCRDYSDEQDCPPATCGESEFTCGDGTCIDSVNVCDGQPQCPDHTDEVNCPARTCTSLEVSCGDGSCIDIRKLCDAVSDCSDGLDEQDCDPPDCADDEFKCNNGVCLSVRQRCDGHYDCEDGSDEFNCGPVTCSSSEWMCTSGECIDQSMRCNREYNCQDGSDENDCASCSSAQFRCRNGDCIDLAFVCNERYDCRDRSDEVNCAPPSCRSDEFRCQDGSCIDLRRRCDRRRDCRDSSDELDCDVSRCTPYQFRCDNGDCIDTRLRCNRRYDCHDGSDEFNCEEEMTCSPTQYQCESGECIDASLVCDTQYNCHDGSDEQDCGCAVGQYTCGSSECISESSRCDGRVDCRDGSDEQGCRTVTVSVSPERLRIREGMTATFICRVLEGGSYQLQWARSSQALPGRATDRDGRLTIPEAHADDSDRYTCSVVGQEHYRAHATLTVEYIIGPVSTPQPPPVGDCARDQMQCRNGQCVPRDYSCDGDNDCADRSDELNCIPMMPCEPNEFQCLSGKCVQKIWRCDGDDDCGDSSDEQDCPTAIPGSFCNYDEFRCASVDQCIPASYQCDGEVDCQDTSDEMGCVGPVILQPPPGEHYAQQGESVSITCRARGVPTPLIVWRLNWGHIKGPPSRVYYTNDAGYGVLHIMQVRKEDEGAYTCEALNSKGSIFAQPDTILIVNPPVGICSPPYFNSEAERQDQCLQCFCFDMTDQCVSSSLNIGSVSVANKLPLVNRDSREDIGEHFVEYNPLTRQFNVRDYSRRVTGEHYFSLPNMFLNNKITSYGGSVRYTVSYEVDTAPSFIRSPDLIIAGNGLMLYHTQFTEPFNGAEQTADIQLTESAWSLDEYGRQRVNREDFILALQNVDYILVKSHYDNNQRSVRMSRLSMTVAGQRDMGQGRALLVEQCSCPTGYTGSSCEDCGTGYYRVESGQYLGRCAPCNCNGHSNDCDPDTGHCLKCLHNAEGRSCDRCLSGYYGDATRGTPNDCLACACPLATPGNSFSKTCYLETDGELSCDACPPEYAGRSCDRCAPGYEGNPSAPGDYCKPIGQRCDPRGSLTLSPDPTTGQCECKPYATGQSCSNCVENSFHLAEDYPQGCVACVCMGVTQMCSSTTWNRAQVSLGFGQDAQGVTITNAARNTEYTDNLRVDRRQRQLTYTGFQDLPLDTYYWALPQKFLNNKVTSYGGFLRFTVSHTDGHTSTDFFPDIFPDVELRGNNIVLEYYHSVLSDFSSGPSSFQVSFFEHDWVRPDGIPATREHLLMALADLDYILIKATYTGSTTDAGISALSMDIAEDRVTGLDRAYEVEQCQCPVGYSGLSCENCDHGYRRTGGGLFLGNCGRCDCNGHSQDCDTATGLCRACQHNTKGDRCERCAPGYYGDPSRGSPNDCQLCPCPLTYAPNQFSPTCMLEVDNQATCTACPPGHTGRRCEQCLPGYQGNPMVPGDYCKSDVDTCSCDPKGTIPNTQCDPNSRQCQCKAYVSGNNCDSCKPGYYYMDTTNAQGCLSCYCNGVTDQCTSSNYFRSQISPMYDAGSHNFVLTSRRLSEQITDGFQVDARLREITFNKFEAIQRDRQSLYFSLPPRFRGNQVASYGGNIKFTLEYAAALDSGNTFRDVDLELISNGNRFYHTFHQSPTPYEHNAFTIPLREDTFVSLGGSEPTRESFLDALSHIDAILIRATHHSIMASATLRDLTMDTAVPQDTGLGRAMIVEQCSCPQGYAGLSCQDCSAGYSHMPDPNNPRGRCVGCNCNGHTQTCDPSSGSCVSCQHNTAGDRCHECVLGYYGDATVGTPNDCRPCPCPLTLPPNQFSSSCYLDADGQPTCNACPPEYTGRNCERCATGYVGDPREPGNTCRRDTGNEAPQVEVTPKTIAEAVNANITFHCQVRGRGPFNVQWIRGDGKQLSSRTQVDRDNSLTIRSASSTDAGSYICVATNAYGRGQDETNLVIVGERLMRVVVQEPRRQTVQEGATVSFVCKGYSKVSHNRRANYTYTLAWTKDNGRLPRWAADDGHGLLVIRNVHSEDAGTYNCIGSNAYSLDTDSATLTVSGSDEPPKVEIVPRVVRVSMGDPIEMRCVGSGRPQPRIEWSRRGDPLNPLAQIDGDTLRIQSASLGDEGEYVCTGTNPAGRSDVRILVYVLGGPPTFEVEVGQPEFIVLPGHDAQLPCSARGTVIVDRINWDREGAPLPPGSYQQNGMLVIPKCEPTHSGRYICTITLVDGAQNHAYTTLTVDHSGDIKQPPTATMNQDRMTITQGTTGTLRCDVTGEPTPTIVWSKVQAELGPNHLIQGNVLRILEATPTDRGLYVCRAENAAGVAQASISVEVERREAPRVEIYPETTTIISAGSSALFQCRVIGGIPSPTVVWARANNERFTSNTDVLDSGVLRFNQVTGDEQGPYICTATNEAGSVTATASLKIQGAPRVTVTPPGPLTVYPGQRVSFECVAEGDPPATVYWQSPHGYRLEGPDSAAARPSHKTTAVVTIQRITANEAGTYACSARNDVGESRKTIEIIVQNGGGVNPGGFVSVSVIPKSVSVSEGSTAQFACQAVGNPTPTVTWRREGGEMSRNYNIDRGVLQLYRVTAEDAGIYTCIAMTPSGQEKVSATLHVQVAPEVTVSPSLLTIRPGEPLRLRCMTQGSGDVTIEWTKVGGVMSAAARIYDGVLEIQPVTAADAGRYKCLAINDYGRSEAFVEVNLHVLPSASVSPSVSNAQVGGSIELRCNAAGSPPPRIQWVKQGGNLPDQHQTREGSLILYDLSPEDSGVYVCIVSNNAGDYRSYAELTVQGSGTAEIVERVQTVTEGSTIEINCAVASYDVHLSSPPLIQWDRVGARMPANVVIQNDRLIIQRIRTSDAGVYRCTASNDAGESIAQVIINVEAPPAISLERQVRVASLGSQLTLTCDVTGGSPPPTIQWRKRDGELPRDHQVRDGVLTIRQLRTQDLGEYICIASNKFGTSKGYILVDTGELVPYFDQNPVSYVSYPTINDAYLTFDIEMSFKPSATEGLLLYNGVMDGGSGDFISFGMRDKRAELRFNVGAGPAIIVSDPLTLEEWYTVTIHRDNKEGTLVVNGREYKGVSPGDFRGLDLEEDMYVGGLPDFSAIARDAGFNTGFVGCISRVVINGLALNLGGEAHDMSGVRDCPVCQQNPCDHQGRCKPALTEVGYECECPSGYSGKQCEMIGERCYTGACGQGGRCFDMHDGTGYSCACPVGKTGDRCQSGTEVREPAFTEDSFIAYPTPTDATFELQVYMMVKPRSSDDSILLYSAQNDDGSGDYVALTIKDEHVEFMYNLGSGPAVVRSREKVVPGQWMTILAERNQRDGSLSINNEQAEKGQSPSYPGYVEGDTIGLNLRTSLFVGGVDREVRVAAAIGVTQGFTGCISQLSLKGTAVDLVNDAIDSSNVQDCGVESPCAKRPCQHNGLCIELSPTQYRCNCPRDYTGVDCELEMNVCITNNPCGVRGQCVVDDGRPTCHCFLGYGGLYCGENVELYDNVQLDGTGYIELHQDLLPHNNAQTQEVLEMTISTTESEALLFWQGQEANEALEGSDYLAILVQNGRVVFSYELGSGPANITSKDRIDDGLPHLIVVTRTGNQGSLQVDTGHIHEGSSEGILSMLNTKGNIYIGGLPNMDIMTNDRFYWRLVGCIQEVFIHGQGPIDFGTYPIGGINVLPCDNL